MGICIDNLGRDRLSTLPSELLLMIISEVPLSSFLDLVHTSKGLREFIKANARKICNLAIESRFPLQAKYLRPAKVSGWITPTHWAILEWEERAVEESRGRIDYRRVEDWKSWDYKIKLGEPGPQYLALLESDVILMSTEKGLRASQDLMRRFLRRMNGVWATTRDRWRVMLIRDRSMVWYYGFPNLEYAQEAKKG
jgi:hypothetical protein